jgi:hypothetical protein
MKKVVCDKNGNQSGIHADAHDVVSHTGDLLDQKKNTGDLQISGRVYPRSSVQRQYQIMFTLGSPIRLN